MTRPPLPPLPLQMLEENYEVLGKIAQAQRAGQQMLPGVDAQMTA